MHDPDLRFCGFALGFVQFVDEDGLVLASAPRFGDLRADRPRRPPTLISQRICLLLWKSLRQFEEALCAFPGQFEDVKLPMMLNLPRCCHTPLTFSPSHFLGSLRSPLPPPPLPGRSSA